MKLLILSDLHLEQHRFDLPTADYDVVVLAGDIAAPGRDAVAWAASQTPPGRTAIVVAGNHEFYGSCIDAELQAMRQLAVPERACVLDCQTTVVGSVRFVGSGQVG